MFNSVQPQRRQPTRLPRPWDSPGKSTGVGCHCLLWFPSTHHTNSDLNALKMWSECHSVASDSLRPHGLYSPWNSPGQNSGVDSCSLLQGIFPTQVSRIAGGFLTSWDTKETPAILEWVIYPSSSGSSQPRNRTRVSCIAGRFFTSWATREAQKYENQGQMQQLTPLCHPELRNWKLA